MLEYLRAFAWRQSVEERYFGAGIGGIVAILLFGIVPDRARVDEWLWVVVGDLPSAYLVTDDCKLPSEALEGYIAEMRKWVRLAKAGRTSPAVIPVNVPATAEWAKELEGRLSFLKKISCLDFAMMKFNEPNSSMLELCVCDDVEEAP
jgi:hypothetical protein